MTGPLAAVRVVVLAGMGPVPFAADAFVEGYRPGVTERLGLAPEAVLRRNPAIVYARLTGYGQAGPLARAAGHDINYVAQSGALHAMARAGEAPRPPVNLLGDYAGGGMMAAFGIACALIEARASGRGQVVDAAMVDGVALLTARLQGLRAAGLFSDRPGTNWIDSGAPFYDTYRCADGRYLAVGALEPDFYREVVSRLGVDVAGWPDQDDRAAWPRLRGLIAAAVAARPQAVQPHPAPVAGRAADQARRCGPAPGVLVHAGDHSGGGGSWLSST